MLGPGNDGFILVSLERTVIEPLRLKENDGIVVLDRGDQQALGIVGIGRNHRLQSRDMGKDRFWTLTMRLAAKNAAAIGRAHRQWCRKLTARTVAQARSLRHKLIRRGIDVIGKLNLDDGP